MGTIAIEGRADRHGRKGDFDAAIDAGRLVVDREIADRLHRMTIRTAEDLIVYLDSFPAAVASALDWRLEEVRSARSKLAETLQGQVDARLLHPALGFLRGTGALHPGRAQEPESEG